MDMVKIHHGYCMGMDNYPLKYFSGCKYGYEYLDIYFIYFYLSYIKLYMYHLKKKLIYFDIDIQLFYNSKLNNFFFHVLKNLKI